MNLVSVCFVANHHTTQLSIDILIDNIKKTGTDVELLFYCNQFKGTIPNASLVIENSTPFLLLYAECVNQLLRNANGTHLCILYENAIYQDDWLLNTLKFYEQIKLSGIAGNFDITNQNEIHCLTNQDELFALQEYQSFNGFCFFRRNVLEKIGGLNEEFSPVAGFNDYLTRSKKVGFFNFILPKQYKNPFGYYLEYQKTFQPEKQKDFVPLFVLSSKYKNLLIEIQRNLDKKAIFCNYRGYIILAKEEIKNTELNFLFELQKNYKINIRTSTISDLGILKSKLVISII